MNIYYKHMPEEFQQAVEVIQQYCQNEDCDCDCNECPYNLAEIRCGDVTKTGRWIEVIDETDSLGNKTWHHECSICGSDKSGWGTYKHCPDCGTKMEVKE